MPLFFAPLIPEDDEEWDYHPDSFNQHIRWVDEFWFNFEQARGYTFLEELTDERFVNTNRRQ